MKLTSNLGIYRKIPVYSSLSSTKGKNIKKEVDVFVKGENSHIPNKQKPAFPKAKGKAPISAGSEDALFAPAALGLGISIATVGAIMSGIITAPIGVAILTLGLGSITAATFWRM